MRVYVVWMNTGRSTERQNNLVSNAKRVWRPAGRSDGGLELYRSDSAPGELGLIDRSHKHTIVLCKNTPAFLTGLNVIQFIAGQSQYKMRLEMFHFAYTNDS